MDCVSCLKVLLLKNDGFLLFGCFKQFVNVLGLFLLFRMGFKFLKLSCSIWGLLSEPKNGFCSRIGFNGKCNSKLSSCKCELLKLLWNSSPPMIEKLEETKQNVVNSINDVNEDSDSDDVHEVFDVMALRKLVKKERAKANAARLELEKERMASTTAAEEAMAMILRLQNEKSLIELEANHYRRLAKEKQQHDQQVIQSLQWIVMKHESERSVLEERLRICRQKLKIYIKGDDEGDHYEGFDEFLGFSNANFEDDLYL